MTTFKRVRAGSLAGLALAGALTLAACATATGGSGGGAYGGVYGGSTSSSPTNTPATTGQLNLTCAGGATVCTKSVSVSGQATTVLANTKGMTLYYFTPDTATSVACSGSCAQTWPPLTTTGSTPTGSGFSGALTTLNAANGDQVVYNGHQLYTFSGDQKQTDAKGEGILGKWYVAFPGLAASSSTSGGNGYYR